SSFSAPERQQQPLPIGPAGAATQIGAGAAALITSGIDTSQALAAAVAVGVLGRRSPRRRDRMAHQPLAGGDARHGVTTRTHETHVREGPAPGPLDSASVDELRGGDAVAARNDFAARDLRRARNRGAEVLIVDHFATS